MFSSQTKRIAGTDVFDNILEKMKAIDRNVEKHEIQIESITNSMKIYQKHAEQMRQFRTATCGSAILAAGLYFVNYAIMAGAFVVPVVGSACFVFHHWREMSKYGEEGKLLWHMGDMKLKEIQTIFDEIDETMGSYDKFEVSEEQKQRAIQLREKLSASLDSASDSCLRGRLQKLHGWWV